MAVSTFKKYVEENNLHIEVIETSSPTHTAKDAAEVHGVPVSNIVKSLLVKSVSGFELRLTPGDRRLELGKDERMANADEVKRITGYSIGGVPPFGHTQKINTVVVDGFDGSEMLVAAAGSANSVFKISLDELKDIVL
jgi:prolyl-tRNA editing enzyme YbaK/EbsC (Cys-tRNA(Pro) deacylase)